jgi:hypothetical protein
MIQANCRAQLTVDDFRFLVEVLARKSSDQPSLEALLGDESSLNQLLDDDAVFDAILNRNGCLKISPHLYFYVIARRILRNAGIEDRAVADYLGEMLTEFSNAARVHTLPTRPGQQFEYISDLLAVIREARQEETFVVRAHIGNYTLFLTGVFPQHLEHRTRFKGAPDISFYEGVGSQNFRILSDNNIAHRKQLHDVFNCLGEQFHQIRVAMNDMSDRLLHLDTGDARVDAALKLIGGDGT